MSLSATDTVGAARATVSMMRAGRLFAAVALVLWGGLFAGTAAAQTADVRVLDRRADGLVVEVTAVWPLSLAAAVDSAGGAVLTRGVVAAATGGLVETSETFTLPTLALPRARIVEVDAEEVRLAPGAPGLAAALRAPAVEMMGLGVTRKAPTATLAAQLLTYDEASGILRRYRRLVVAVDYATGTSAAAPQQAFAARGGLDVQNVTRSVLADGTVFKIPITEEGIYRIDRAFLTALDLDPNAIEPNTLKLYHNGGAPLPALVGAARPVDLVENPVYVQGGGDGAFNEGDALLFFASAPRGWRYSPSTGEWEHFVNPFTNENYVFLKVGGVAGRRVEAGAFPAYPDAEVVEVVTGRHMVEFDEYMWSKEEGSGLTWVSRTLRSGGTRPLLAGTVLPGMNGGEVIYRIRAALRSTLSSASLAVRSGGALLGSLQAGTVGQDPEDFIARGVEQRFTQTVGAGAALDLSVQLGAQPVNAEAAVDWLRVFYPQALRAEGGYLRFASPGGRAGRFEFALRGFTQEPQVWDVTEPGAVRRLGVVNAGGAYRVQLAVTEAATPRELVAFVPGTAAVRPAPAGGVRVAAQDLHGIQAPPDFVIVTHEDLRESAEALAAYRRADGLGVEVVFIDQIYNEFSGGRVDMRAVRDFFKMLYERDDAGRFRYALLFGDGHFNFRQIGNESERPVLPNLVPPYETQETFYPEATYTSDDYFGLLDNHEGLWVYTSNTSPGPVIERVDLGIGRLTATTAEEARVVVDKIKHYESPATYGPWRARYTFLADDGPTGTSGQQNDQDLHLQNADVVAEAARQEFTQLNIKKIYASSFTREFLNGWRVPAARRAALQALDEGSLLFNYSGHGGPSGLAQEELITKQDILALDNYDRLAVFVTATCSFGWWDMGRDQSGAEELLLNPNGGAVALMTTVRLVYTWSDTTTLNVGLNLRLNRELFKPDDEGRPRRLGDVLRLTKNTRVGLEGNNRKFNLLGDPTLRIGLPTNRAAVEAVNGAAVGQNEGPAPIRALERVTLEGAVRGPDGALQSDFEGLVDLTVFDAARRVPIEERRHMPRPYYVVREDLIWRGTVRAKGGRYTATFVVPKDISYSGEPGRISAYAHGTDRHAIGYTENVVVGGTAAQPPDDSDGPRLRLFLNDTTFVSGGLTRPDARLIVQLFDESGINTVGAGVGHEMLLVVDGEEASAVDLSDRFQSAEDSYQRGSVVFPLDDYPRPLAPGMHTLTVKAWDVLNNATTAELAFYVTEEQSLVLRNVYNYPNPMSGQTRFMFEHNQPPGTPARVRIRIYSLAGRSVRTIDADEALPSGTLTGGPVQVFWDGRDDDFDRVATGIYLYQVRVEVDRPDGEREVREHIERIAVLR